MREIKFQGKRVDNGEWVYGLPVNYCNKTYILVLTDFEEERVYEQYPHKEMWPYEVIPETVGQYTGLDDKNGVKIFEGDILRGSMVNLIVAYEGAGFIAYWMDHDYGYGTEKMWCNLVEGGEVIGNIHDNTEVTE